MVDRRPAFQFYPADWKADDALMSCSLSAQGLWIYIMCVMHYTDPYGHLVTRAGEAMPSKQLAKLARSDAAEIDSLLDELAEARVYSITDQGVIFSRRMVFDYERYLLFQKHGRRGGLASARSKREGGGTTAQQAKAEPSLEHLNDSSSSSSSSSSTSSSSSQETHVCLPFAALWELVPRGRKVAKVKAQELWEGEEKTTTGETITNEEQHVIMDRYPHHVAMWRRDDQPTGKIPHLRTWLNQRRWEDEIEGTDSEEEKEKLWACGCYRLADQEKHGDDPDWDCYQNWATDYSLEHGQFTSPTFDEFKKGKVDG